MKQLYFLIKTPPLVFLLKLLIKTFYQFLIGSIFAFSIKINNKLSQLRNRKENWFTDLYLGSKILLVIFILAVILLSSFLFYRVYITDHHILHLYFLPILLGLTIEYWRISKNFHTVLLTALAAFVLSFFNFLPSKHEHGYHFKNHLEFWPFAFLGIYIFLAMIIQFTQATKKLTEGITLLLTISINYWILSNNYWHSDYLVIKFLIIINGIFSAYSIFHAISYKNHSKASVFILSVWSSIITLILSFDNIIKVYQYKDLEHMTSLSESSFSFLQFFFLGISSIYIAQNIIMVGAFLPGKHYLETIRDIADVHIGRYSDEQVYLFDAILVGITSMVVFAINYRFQFLPTNFMIWAMITITPYYVYGLNKLIR